MTKYIHHSLGELFQNRQIHFEFIPIEAEVLFLHIYVFEILKYFCVCSP